MGWANKLIGWATGNGVEVDANNRLLINLAQQSDDPAQVGGVRLFSEVDQGLKLPSGSASLASLISPEADNDYRLRVSSDTFLDEESFVSAAQNTGKHTASQTTLAFTWAATGLTTNSGAITTANTGATMGTYALFPLFSTATLAVDIHASFSAAAVTNTTIDFGLFTRGSSTQYAPSDGAYFRLTSAGMQGVINYNGVETSSTVFNFTYVAGTKYQFILYCTRRQTQFWINNGTSTDLYGTLPTPAANNNPFAQAAQPFSVRHAIASGGAASGALSMVIGSYNVRLGSTLHLPSFAAVGNRIYGSYQGLSGGTMGSLANYANSTNPSPAAPTNTTAALGTGMGGQFWETPSLASGTDGIICSYQNPAQTTNIPGRRMIINGVWLTSYIQTVISGGPWACQYSLAFGNNALTLAGSETSVAKLARRIALPPLTQAVTLNQAVSTLVSQLGAGMTFANPIVLNPGEYIALAAKKIGTVGASGTVAHMVAFDYGWE